MTTTQINPGRRLNGAGGKSALMSQAMEPYRQVDRLTRQLASEQPAFRREDIEFALLLAGIELGGLHDRERVRSIALKSLHAFSQSGGLLYRQLPVGGDPKKSSDSRESACSSQSNP